MTEQTQKRQIVLDTETTGISTAEDHRIIEIGCVELISRRSTGQTFHQYINPQREIDAGAIEVHGITNKFLADKPLFEEVAEDFLTFIDGAQLIIHNAPFDVGFIDHELAKLKDESRRINTISTVLDTLKMARDKHPGQKNSLDALCKRYHVNNSDRELHGALLDAEILADVYLAMTGGQVSMLLAADEPETVRTQNTAEKLAENAARKLKVICANDEELQAHKAMLEKVQKASEGNCVWLKNSQN